MNALGPVRTEPQRLRFSLADVDLMVQRGIMAENARIELIDGDLIEMASEGGPHIDHKVALNRWFVRRLSDEFELAPDATLRLSPYDAPEPDLYIFPARLGAAEVRGPDVLLAVELADTTQTYDLQRKAVLYAKFEVREYWVLDIPRRKVHVHTEPAVAGYASIQVVGYDDALTPTALPGLTLRLSDIERLNRG